MKAGTLSESGRIRPHLTPLECGIIFGGIPAGAISRKGGLIWGIPVNITKDAVAALEALGIPLFAQVGHRTGYQITGTDGDTIFGGSHSQAEEEVGELAKNILSIIKVKLPARQGGSL